MLIGYLKELTGREMGEDEVKMMNPLVLAYIGDTIYDLLVRTCLLYTSTL